MKLQLAFRAYLSGIFFQHKYLPEEDQITLFHLTSYPRCLSVVNLFYSRIQVCYGCTMDI